MFLLPGCLQFDLSFTPASKFGAYGSEVPVAVRRIGGKALSPCLPAAQELFGYAVHHALRARFCIERRRYWHAEYWISAARDYALSLACRRARTSLILWQRYCFDDLPAEVRDGFADALVLSLERDELLRALGSAIAGLLREADEVRELAAKAEPELHALTAA